MVGHIHMCLWVCVYTHASTTVPGTNLMLDNQYMNTHMHTQY